MARGGGARVGGVPAHDRRHLPTEPGPSLDPSQAGARLVAQILVAVLVIGLLTAAAVRHFVLSPGSGAPGDALIGQEAAARDAAAA